MFNIKVLIELIVQFSSNVIPEFRISECQDVRYENIEILKY